MSAVATLAPHRLIVDGWYAEALRSHVADPILTVDEVVLARFPSLGRFLVRRNATRALALVASARTTDTVVSTDAAPGCRWLIAASAVISRRNLILLEYISHAPTGRGPRAALRRVEFIVLRRLLLSRALLAAQVLTSIEVDRYADSHWVEPTRFKFVPWPARFDGSAVLPDRGPAGRRVLCSGRRVDWATFAKAAWGADWTITAVCAAADAQEVTDLLSDTEATIHVEIDLEAHYALVGAAAVFVVALPETGASIGQVRVMNAADAGTPLVVSRVQGVEEYVDDSSAVLVEPRNPDALREAVDDLLDDPDRQQLLRRALFDRGAGYDMSAYLARLGKMVTLTAAAAQDRD